MNEHKPYLAKTKANPKPRTLELTMGAIRRQCDVVFFAFFAMISSFPCEAMGRDFTMQEVIAARDFYESSIEQLQGTFTFHYLPTPGARHGPNALVMEDLLLETSFVIDVGARFWRYDEVKSWIYSDLSPTERFQVRTVRTSADNKFQSLLHTLAKDPLPSDVPADVPHKLHYFARSQTEADFAPTHFVGIPVRSKNLTIGELLRLPAAKLEGSEKIAGSNCVLISVGNGTEVQLRLWLDPAHDLLPRRQELGNSRQPGGITVIECVEFQQFADAAGGANRWFPTRGLVKSEVVEDREWRITELTINPGVSKADILINPATLPPGVAVRGDGRGRWYTGDRQDIFDEVERKVEAHDKEMERLLLSKRPLERGNGQVAQTNASSLNPIRVASGSTRWIYWTIGVVSAGVLAVGLFLIVRARNR